jgi:hypothetical protein
MASVDFWVVWEFGTSMAVWVGLGWLGGVGDGWGCCGLGSAPRWFSNFVQIGRVWVGAAMYV